MTRIQGARRQKTVDVHTHVISPELLTILRRDGARYGVELVRGQPEVALLSGGARTKPIQSELSDVDRRLPTMDTQGVDVQVLSSWIDFTGYGMPVAEGAAFSRLQNETIAELVQTAPTRFVGSVTVPLQDPATAVEVLVDAVERHGFRAVQIGTQAGGRHLDEPDLEPFWGAAESLGVLVLVHPHDDAPPPALKPYFLWNVVGNPVLTTVALVRLVYGGVIERHPGLRVSFAHGGGMLPYQVGRVRRGFRQRPETRAGGLTLDPLDALKRCYFDTVLNEPRTIAYLADLVGADRLLMGGDYPFEMGDPEPVKTVQAALGSADQAAVLGKTAACLLGLG